MTINKIAPSDEPEHLTHPPYRADIDGLRALAVLSVVAFHSFPSKVKGGFIGVDIFFVISGYLISMIIFGSLQRDRFSFVEFYSRRVRRIFPSLIIVLTATYALGWLTLLADEYKQLGKHIAGGAGFVSNFVLWQESGYFDTAATTKPLLHLWSLGIEEQFYIIWPFLLWLAWKQRLNLWMVTSLLACISFILNMVVGRTDAIAAFYSPQTRFWELLIGAVLAGTGPIMDAQVPIEYRNPLQNFRSILGAALIAFGIRFISQDRHLLGLWYLLPTVGTALVISAGPKAWVNRSILSNRVLVWFGLISYPLYLWHWPLIVFSRIIGGDNLSIQKRLIIIIISIVLAWLTYRFIELPVRLNRHVKLIATMLFVGMVFMGLAGYGCYKKDGLMFRLPQDLQEAFDWGSFARVGTCTLNTSPSQTEQPSFCFEKRRPLVVLWGDSHAGALYPGLKDLQNKFAFGIVQVDQAGCPPVFDISVERQNCNMINQTILKKLSGLNPDTIILHSAWVLPAYQELNNEGLFRLKVDNTVAIIKKRFSKSKMILIGPFPRWDNPPLDNIVSAWRSRFVKTKKLEFRPKLNILNGTDRVLKDIALEHGIDYISPIHILCFEGSCIYKVGEKPTDLISFDGQHISKSGAEFFIGKIKREIFSNAREFKE